MSKKKITIQEFNQIVEAGFEAWMDGDYGNNEERCKSEVEAVLWKLDMVVETEEEALRIKLRDANDKLARVMDIDRVARELHDTVYPDNNWDDLGMGAGHLYYQQAKAIRKLVTGE